MMALSQEADVDSRTSLTRVAGRRTNRAGRTVVGGFFLMMAGVHLGLVSADPQVYATFADQSYFAFVREGWRDIVMADPRVWGLLLMSGELLLGSFLLAGGRWARAGWLGVITFHLLLLFFGWWVWAWSLPAIALLVVLARADTRPDPAPVNPPLTRSHP